MNTQDRMALLRQQIARFEAELATLYQNQIEADYDADPSLLTRLPAQIHFLQKRLEDLRHAYDRTCRNQHRFCEDCGQLIEVERLEAYPEATRCIVCARRLSRILVSHSPPSCFASLGA